MTETTDRREQRISKLEQLVAQGIDPYPARVHYTHTAAQALEAFAQAAEGQTVNVEVVGRLLSMRDMGKSAFAHIADGSGRIQLYVRKDMVGEATYGVFHKLVDIGDFIGAAGKLFKTRTGETTVEVQALQILSKTLRPLPEKWHGLKDVEARYRQRYLDLIANEEARRIFVARTRIISAMRRYLDERGFLEVETPTLQPIYGGANARPFTTHHNALDQKLYLRIADELYLKRLIIGGLDRVYEIAHNFRNEGIDTLHNPEFTSVEMYQAYADYHDMMRLVEEIISTAAQQVLGSMVVTYQGQTVDLTPPWRRVTMRDLILEGTGIDIAQHTTYAALWTAAQERGLAIGKQPNWGKLVDELFGEHVQPKLIQPTFMLDYPIEISPLAKKIPGSQDTVERFEFFIAGMECGNAFTELNDPLDQRERFVSQRRLADAGDEETQPLDEDFLTAMEHGMPPTGGLGIGIDRIVMLLTDQTSIREVILFPQLRSK